MKTDIREQFIEVCCENGTLGGCIAAIQYKYDILWYQRKATMTEERTQNYSVRLPAMIKEVDEDVIRKIRIAPECPMEYEISENLEECKDAEKKEKYIFSWLKPLKQWSWVRFPELTTLPTLSENFPAAAESVRSKQWTVKQRFAEISRNPDNNDKAEMLYFMLTCKICRFADMLDAICLRYGIDLLNLQRKYDVYLKDERDVATLVPYIGSEERVQKLIDALPKQGQLLPSWKQAKDTPEPFKCEFTSDQLSELYNGLREAGFIDDSTDLSHFQYVFGGDVMPENEKSFKPLKWIKTNSKTKGESPNKRSLLDFLTLLGIPEMEIKEKIKGLFIFSNNSKMKRNNYGYKGNSLVTVSEFHGDLVNIIKKSKEN